MSASFSRRLFFIGLLLGLSGALRAAPAHTENNLAYLRPADAAVANAYRKERAVLDLYIPSDAKACPVVVWFHGGSLNSGNKWIPEELKNRGYIVVAPNYRLTPKAKAVNTIEDAAAAVVWVFENIARYGGDPRLVFLSGHSAGGYLSTMVTLDRHWLRAFGLDADRVAGLIPFSGQMITHAAFRGEAGIAPEQPVVDAFAPLYHVRADAPPFLMITGDREQELWGRYDENTYMARMMKIVGHTRTRLVEIPGTDHGGMVKPAFPLLIAEIERIVAVHAGAAATP